MVIIRTRAVAAIIQAVSAGTLSMDPPSVKEDCLEGLCQLFRRENSPEWASSA